jgi:hypothetical protein
VVFKGTVIGVKALAKKGGIFVAGRTVIVNKADDVVVKSGRVPTTLMLYVPAGLA